MIGVFGDLIVDLTVQAHGPLQLGSDVTGTISSQGGGSAANVAAWLGSLGKNVRFVGAIGVDLVGQIAQAELEQYGVACYIVQKPAPTGTILLFLDEGGERTMVTSRGANLLLEETDFPDRFFQDLRHLHFTAYSLFGSEKLAKVASGILERALEQQIPVSLDPSSYALLAEFGVQRFLKRTQGVRFLFPNLEEGRQLSGKSHPKAIVEELLTYYPVVVLTLGPAGCLCGHGQDVFSVEVAPRPVVDTTGAGDAFVAGFLAEYYANLSLKGGAERGNSVASEAIGHYGGRPLLRKVGPKP